MATDSPTFHHQNHRECETVTWNSFSKCLVSRHIFIRDSKSRWMDRNSGKLGVLSFLLLRNKFAPEENKAYGISLGHVSTCLDFPPPPFQHRCLTTRVKPFQKKMASDIHLNNAQRIPRSIVKGNVMTAIRIYGGGHPSLPPHPLIQKASSNGSTNGFLPRKKFS